MAGEREREGGVLALEVDKLLRSEELPWVAAMDGEGGSSGERVK